MTNATPPLKTPPPKLANNTNALRELATYLARKIHIHRIQKTTEASGQPRTFLIGVTGSVCVGKTTFAHELNDALNAHITPSLGAPLEQSNPVSSDGFLYRQNILEKKGITQKKGFPESFDQQAFVAFLNAIRNGKEAKAPLYSHEAYDILKGAYQTIQPCEPFVVLEGVNILHPTHITSRAATHDVTSFFDQIIYLNANPEDLENWYIKRFVNLWRQAKNDNDPKHFFYRFSSLTQDEVVKRAAEVWQEINWPNFEQNINPHTSHASLWVNKDVDHCILSIKDVRDFVEIFP